MKIFLIILIVLTIAVFTGTWIFGGLGWIFDFLSSGCNFLARVFDLFGWSNGVI